MIDLYTIWALEPSESDTPWCVDAWDEFSVGENNSGWQEALAKAEAANTVTRVIRIRINESYITAAFNTPVIGGEVSND